VFAQQSLQPKLSRVLVFRMLYRITQSSKAHRAASVSVMDHEQTMGVSSTVLDQTQQNETCADTPMIRPFSYTGLQSCDCVLIKVTPNIKSLLF